MKTLSFISVFFVSILSLYAQNYTTRGQYSNNTSHTIADVTISGPDTLCSNDIAIFIATPVNGGSAPIYQWYLNGNPIYISSDTLVWSVFSNSDTLYCSMISNLPGVTNNPDTSNFIILTIIPRDTAVFNYSKQAYCVADSNPTPIINGTPGGIFKVIPSGLAIDSVTGTIDLSNSTLNKYTITYTTLGICPDTFSQSVIVDTFVTVQFYYPGNKFCKGGQNPLPTVIGPTNGVFSSSGGLLFVNDSTGEIDLTNSLPGAYSITYSVNKGCNYGVGIASYTLYGIQIVTGLNNADFQYIPSNYCKTVVMANPTINGVWGGLFQSYPSGLVIDSISGTIYPNQSTAGTYTIINTISGLCTGADSQMVSIFAPAIPVFSYPKNVCKGIAMSFITPVFVDSSVLQGSIPPVFSVVKADSTDNIYLDGDGKVWLIPTDPGTYYVSCTVSTAQCATGAIFTDTLNIYDCVWPGDANNDKEVWALDLLSVGLYYSETGIPRVNPTNLWQPQIATNWGTQIMNGSDKRHVDCNGDGVIDFNDTVAINLNFNSSHLIPPYNPGDTRLADPALYFVTQNNTYYPGDWVTAELWAGSASQSVSNFYGLAFIFSYPIHLIQTGSLSFSFDSVNWTGTNGVDALQMSYVETGLWGRVLGAISRINHTNVNGYGKIGEVTFQIDTGIDSLESLYLFFSDYMANDSIGDTLKFNPISKSLGITPLTSVSESGNSTLIVSVSPNPFTKQTTISLNKELSRASIKMFDVLGKEVKSLPFSGRKIIIEREELKSGIYFVRLMYDNEKCIIKKLVVQDF